MVNVSVSNLLSKRENGSSIFGWFITRPFCWDSCVFDACLMPCFLSFLSFFCSYNQHIVFAVGVLFSFWAHEMIKKNGANGPNGGFSYTNNNNKTMGIDTTRKKERKKTGRHRE